MNFNIHRDTGWTGGLGRITIRINNTSMNKLSNHETKTITVDATDVSVQVTQGGSKSNIISATEGDTIHVYTNNWVDFSLIFLLVMPFINSYFFSANWISWANIGLLILYFLMISFIPGFYYRLRKHKKSTESP